MKKPTQTGAALALVQLLQEHPELPAANWSVNHYEPALVGYLQGDSATFDALTEWAHVLGGSICPRGNDYECAGKRLRSHVLTSLWRDVRVELVAIIPLPVSDAYLSDGQLAEQKHQLLDPAVPVAALGVAA